MLGSVSKRLVEKAVRQFRHEIRVGGRNIPRGLPRSPPSVKLRRRTHHHPQPAGRDTRGRQT
jgi:hypothetical protein